MSNPRPPDRAVLCGGCTACCWHDTVVLHTEWGDDPRAYQTTPGRTRRLLAKRPDGGCVYLGPDGCTIHDTRPAVCRGYDCRLACADPDSIEPGYRVRSGVRLASFILEERLAHNE